LHDKPADLKISKAPEVHVFLLPKNCKNVSGKKAAHTKMKSVVVK